jgi:hypothetical protein
MDLETTTAHLQTSGSHGVCQGGWWRVGERSVPACLMNMGDASIVEEKTLGFKNSYKTA